MDLAVDGGRGAAVVEHDVRVVPVLPLMDRFCGLCVYALAVFRRSSQIAHGTRQWGDTKETNSNINSNSEPGSLKHSQKRSQVLGVGPGLLKAAQRQPQPRVGGEPPVARHRRAVERLGPGEALLSWL